MFAFNLHTTFNSISFSFHVCALIIINFYLNTGKNINLLEIEVVEIHRSAKTIFYAI
jgi:hypothetical protein